MGKKTLLGVGLLLWCGLLAHVARADSMAARLGFKPDDRVLIIHADDLGMISAENRASFDALRAGAVQSASIMMTCPALEEVQAFAASPDGARADLGVHVTLNSEWPHYRWGAVDPSGRSLMDSDFWLYPHPPQTYIHGRTEDVTREIRAQVERALAMGFHPTHLDLHMGSAIMKEDWAKAYLAVAREFRLAPMIPRWSESLKNRLGWLGSILDKTKVPEILRQAEKDGFLLLDDLMVDLSGKDYPSRKKAMIDFVHSLKPGVTQLILHIADTSDPDFQEKILKTNADQKSRGFNMELMKDPEILELLRAEKIKFTDWRAIQAAYHWGQSRL